MKNQDQANPAHSADSNEVHIRGGMVCYFGAMDFCGGLMVDLLDLEFRFDFRLFMFGWFHL